MNNVNVVCMSTPAFQVLRWIHEILVGRVTGLGDEMRQGSVRCGEFPTLRPTRRDDGSDAKLVPLLVPSVAR